MKIVVSSLEITVTTGTVTFTANYCSHTYWQATRAINFRIFGATAITPRGTSVISQYEPVGYIYDATTHANALQYDLDPECPNYDALYDTSTGWTPATKTLAAGGVLRIETLGHAPGGMDLAIASFAAAAIANTGTAAGVWTFQISFDGGVLWSAAMNLAALNTDTFIINGNSYTTDGRYNIQLRMIFTSAGGGTVLQVRFTGFTVNPLILTSWNVRGQLDEMSGVGFVTGTHDLHSIHDDLTAGITTITVSIAAALAAILAALGAITTGILHRIEDGVKHIINYLQRAKTIFMDKGKQ
jgi:hypothetical protein